jgi:putative ABC transport system permease protein
MMQDVRQALRAVMRQPGFHLVAMLTLALGIGSVAVVYSVVRQILLDPFPYRDSDRMVDVIVRDAQTDRLFRGALPAPEFLDFQEQSDVFEDVLGTNVVSMHYASDEGADRLAVAFVTPNMFSFLGVQPLAGRAFTAADAEPGAAPIAVMNHRTWMTKFGGEMSVIGRTLSLNGEPRTIVGIMPPRFEWNVGDLWVPSTLSRSDPRSPQSERWFQALLKPGVTVAQAEAQMTAIGKRRAALFPDEYPKQTRIQVITVIDWVVGRFRPVLYTLFAAVGLLLVIACCNVANMLLARATAREREMSLRVALGASRARLVGQLLIESGVLALGGAVGGAIIAYGGIDLLSVWMPRQNVPWETELRLDRYVLSFALATAVISTFIFGLFPALQSARRELTSGSGMGSRGGTSTRRTTRLRNGLVVAEVTLSVVLLLGAGVLMRSFIKFVQAQVDPAPERLLGSGLGLPPSYSSVDQRQALFLQILDRFGSVPGVQSAAITTGVNESPLVIPGVTLGPDARTLLFFVSDRYRQTSMLRLIQGRDLTRADMESRRKVTVVNETFVKRYLGSGNPIGRNILLPQLSRLQPMPVADPVFEIVGVVQDSLNRGVREPVVPDAWLPFSHRLNANAYFRVRTTGDATRMVNTVRQEIRAVSRDVALLGADSLDTILRRDVQAQPRFVLIVLGMFAAAGLVLVALGIYGVLAYTVSQQTREIAIRMAIGGEHRDVLRMVIGAGLRLVAVGVLIGFAASFATNRLLIAQLFNTSPQDAATVVSVALIITIVALAACWVPARRALRIEPMTALRQE